MKFQSFALSFLTLFTATALSGVIVTDYPDPFTQPGDPDYQPKRSYVVPNNQYYNQLPYEQDYETVESRERALERTYDLRRKSLVESNPRISEQGSNINERVFSQQELLRNRLLQQQQDLKSR